MRKTMLKSFAILFSFSVLLLAGCSKSASDTPATTANLSVLNLSPDAGGLDFFVGGLRVVTNLTYPQYTGYTQFLAGSLGINVAPNNTTTNLIGGTLNMNSGSYASFFIVDSLSKIKAKPIFDDLKAPSTDSVKIRFFHFSPNLASVDVSISGGATLFPGRKFSDQDSIPNLAAFSYLKAGSYTFQMKNTGGSTVLASISSLNFIGGKIYTLYAYGCVGGTGTQVLNLGSLLHN